MNYLDTARWLHGLGANVNAIRKGDKAPLNAWKELQARRQTLDELEGYAWSRAAGLGVLNGPGGWRTFDIDDAPDEAPLRAVLQALGLPDNYGWAWRSGSGMGWEVAFLCPDDLPTGVLTAKKDEPGAYWGWPAKEGSYAFHHVELRWQSCQTIYPPSSYTFGKGARKGQAGPGYQWRNGAPPTEPPAVVTVPRVIAAFYVIAPPPPHTLGSIDDATKDAIRERFDMVAFAQEHWGGDTQHESNGEVRVLGHGGLLINPDEGVWHCFSDNIGGDCFELVAYQRYQTNLKHLNGKSAEVLKETALYAGVTLPERGHETKRTTAPTEPAPTNKYADDPRPTVEVADLDIPTLARATWDAIVAANEPPALFRRSDDLVMLDTSTGRAALVPLDRPRTRGLLARTCLYQRSHHGKRGSFTEIVEPPAVVVDDVRAFPDRRLPLITRVVTAPVVAADGSIPTTPGYHAAGQLYYDPPVGLTIPPVADRPSPTDVAQARALILDDLLGDFPFVSDADRAHAVALFLLPFCRELISGPTPLHLVEAPTMGSGKGLLTDVLLLAALGHAPTPMSEAGTDDEWRKRITAQLLDGPAAIFIDNLNRTLDSGSLAAALTTTEWKDRLLGHSEMTRALPVRCVWVATANNPALSTEITRRCVRIRIDTKEDQPWRRKGFRHPKLREWAVEHQGELIGAALTLIRHGLKAEPSAASLGSYEGWAAVIGRILQAAEIPGFLGNLDELYERADTEGKVLRALIAAWWGEHQSAEVGTGDLYDLLTTHAIDLELRGRDDIAKRAAFGKRLRKVADRVFSIPTDDGVVRCQIVAAGTVRRVQRWQLRLVASEHTSASCVGCVGCVGFYPNSSHVNTCVGPPRAPLAGAHAHAGERSTPKPTQPTQPTHHSDQQPPDVSPSSPEESITLPPNMPRSRPRVTLRKPRYAVEPDGKGGGWLWDTAQRKWGEHFATLAAAEAEAHRWNVPDTS